MNKREEIRKVIDTYTDDGCLFPDRSCNALCGGYCSSDTESYKCLMERLDKLGVVIQVGEISDDLAQTASESPKYYAVGKDRAFISSERTAHVFKNFKDMNYVAVERLIE